MRWQYKVAVQKTLSSLPQGEQLNYLLQRRVTKTLPAGEQVFLLHVDQALEHVERFERHAGRGVDTARAYEFGAGWDLVGPLTLWAAGVDEQVLVDIDAHLRLELVDHTIGELARRRGELEERAGRSLRAVDPAPVGSVQELRERFGIEYRAPCDARATGLQAGSFDLISSTYTLEHIPRDDIAAILRESARLLAPGGIVSCSIDMDDHYSYDDPRISPYNFLRYSDRTWRLINSSLHHQNRLRAADYRALFDEAGLTTLDEHLNLPDDAKRAALAEVPLAPRFADRYELDDLAANSMVIVARAPSGDR